MGDTAAATQLYGALLPYRGRLVVWGGANSVNGPASYYLGLLATQLKAPDEAIAHCEDAIRLAERIGALPALAHSLVALGDALRLRGHDGDARRAAGLQRRARELADRLEMTVLLRRLAAPADEWTLRPDRGGWRLEAGQEQVWLADSRGLQHLRALLAAPRRDIPSLDLAAAAPGLRPAAAAPVLERIAGTIPQATVEVWADTGHFPHLAHPRRFADRLAATARWTAIT